MQLEHSFTVDADIDAAWRTLRDVATVASCLPGASVDSASADEASGTLKVKLGPMNLTYRGSALLIEDAPETRRAVLRAQGKDARNGTAEAVVTAQLTADGATTRVALSTELQVTGKPAQFGEQVMHGVGTKIVGQFARNLAALFTQPSGTAGQDAARQDAGPKRPAVRSRPKPRRTQPPAQAVTTDAVGESAAAGESDGTDPADEAGPDTAQTPTASIPDLPAADAPATDAPAGDEAPAVVASAPQPVESAPRTVVAAAGTGTPSFAAPAGIPVPGPDESPSSNGHGTPAPARADNPSDPVVSLVQTARPAVVKGLAPVALAVVLVLGAARRRRRR